MLTPWKKSYNQPRQHIKKQRHYFANKGPSNQGYGFSSSHVWMCIKNHTIKYKDYYNLKLSLGFTPNIGSFANPQAKMNFYVCVNLGKKENRPEQIVNCGLEAKF